MVNRRLQPGRTAPVVSVLFTLVGVFGLMAGAGPAGKLLATTMPSTGKLKSQTPSGPAKPIDDQAPGRISTGGSSTAGTPVADAQSVRTNTAKTLSSAAGRRDPFKPWEPGGSGERSAAVGGGTFGTLPPGIRGLVVSQLRLLGIVRQESTNSMIAVVTNYTKRAYFLRGNDTVYNGVVTRITPDAVYFKENTLDSDGRVGAHEVVMRLGAPTGEGRR